MWKCWKIKNGNFKQLNKIIRAPIMIICMFNGCVRSFVVLFIILFFVFLFIFVFVIFSFFLFLGKSIIRVAFISFDSLYE